MCNFPHVLTDNPCSPSRELAVVSAVCAARQLGGGLSSLCSPSVWYQGQWHRTGRTFPHAVWQCQDCFLPLSFITEAPFSLREPLCVSIFWRHKTACLMMITALQFSPSPTMFYLAGWPWQSLPQMPAASSSSKQFRILL